MDELLYRQMPHSLEAEQAVLGSMLIDANCIKDVMEKLRPEDFYLAPEPGDLRDDLFHVPLLQAHRRRDRRWARWSAMAPMTKIPRAIILCSSWRSRQPPRTSMQYAAHRRATRRCCASIRRPWRATSPAWCKDGMPGGCRSAHVLGGRGDRRVSRRCRQRRAAHGISSIFSDVLLDVL